MDFQQFKQSHAPQLQLIPELYWRALFEKLRNEVYDAGEHFTMSPQEGRWKVVVSGNEVIKTGDPRFIFLIDHAWTYQPQTARHQLLSIPGLAHRMSILMDIEGVPSLDLEEGWEEEEDGESPSSSDGELSHDSDSEVEQGPPPHTGAPPTDAVATEQPINPDLQESELSHDSDSEVEQGPPPHAGGPPTDAVATEQPINPDLQETTDSEPSNQATELPPPTPLSEPSNQALELPPPTPLSEPSNQASELPPPTPPSEELVDKLLQRMWRFNGAYKISNSLVPVWYIMDEFGSRIGHSDDPSFAVANLFFIPYQIAFTVMWPLKDLAFGDEATRNYLPDNLRPGLERACHLIPWSHDSHLTLDDPLWSQICQYTLPEIQERCSELLPASLQIPVPPKTRYKVFTDVELVRTFLTHPAFEITGTAKQADVLWLYEHFKDFRSLGPEQYVNQFPCENVITCKDLLATVAKRANEAGASSQGVGVTSYPTWFPTTYNLLYELPHLVKSYLEKEQKGEDNIWIVKPWNLGRGLDIHICNNLSQIIRLGQAGPKIASRYITNPVLFDRPEIGLVKFDVRYVLLLLSVTPPVLYAYNVFWLRFANKPFSLESFYDYEKHFTVMNYQPHVQLKQVHFDEFIVLFEKQYPGEKWSHVQSCIFKMLQELFASACTKEPPAGIAHSVQSRAIYAVDLMLEWETKEDGSLAMQPKLLEVNYSPDCIRACKYHPDFFNHVFETLFLDRGTWREDLPITKLL